MSSKAHLHVITNQGSEDRQRYTVVGLNTVT